MTNSRRKGKIAMDDCEDEEARLNSILRSMHLTETEAHREWLKFDWHAFERLYESTYGKKGEEEADG